MPNIARGADRQRNGAIGIELVAGTDPPGALEHSDHTIMRMPVGTAHLGWELSDRPAHWIFADADRQPTPAPARRPGLALLGSSAAALIASCRRVAFDRARAVVVIKYQTGRASVSKAEEYYALAARCQDLAGDPNDLYFRREFAQLAEKWKALAKEEEVQLNEMNNANA
jgi:hypothetical protein